MTGVFERSQQTDEVQKTKPSNLGFGLERIGIAALRHPYIASLLLLFSLMYSAFAIPSLGFDGNVINVINRNSKAYRDFKFQNENFRNFSADTWLIVKAPRLDTATGLEELRSLHLDLALEDNVSGVFSIFSLGDTAKGVDSFEPLVPDVIESDEQARQVIANLLRDQPTASAIISPQKKAIMLVVSLASNGPVTEDGLSGILARLKATAIKYAPSDVEILLSGYPAIRAAIVSAIISDQTVLTLLGIAIGALLSLMVFGNFASALVCTIPPAIAVTWILAVFATTGVRLNFLTTVLPTLALIISFADGIVLHFRWQTLNKQSGDTVANLENALWQVGPASSLTSITTAMAFLSFAWASNTSMNDFAFYGMVAVLLAFVAVIVSLPLTCLWSSKLFPRGVPARGPAFGSTGKVVAKNVLKKPSATLIISLLLLVGFGWIHLQLEPSYSTNSHLPYKSEIRAAEAISDEAFDGTSQYLIVVPVSPAGVFQDEENRQRIHAVAEKVSALFGDNKTLSLDQIWRQTEPDQIEEAARELVKVDSPIHGRFLSYDSRSMIVVAQASSGTNTALVLAEVQRLRASFSDLPYAEDLRITGLPILLALEFPLLIDQLRTGLLLAILLAVGIVGVAARSLPLALATLVPNLLPLLFAEAIIWLAGNNLDITNIIALTIAFGIAIDNAVHVINSYNNKARHEVNTKKAVISALREISPALIASTMIVCVALIITQFSAMPSINTLGRLIVLTLVMALISNLVVLPSYMTVLVARFGGNQPDRVSAREEYSR